MSLNLTQKQKAETQVINFISLGESCVTAHQIRRITHDNDAFFSTGY
jgi:hypothetical protein